MLPLFFHNVTKETFVLHLASAADKRRAQAHANTVVALQAANPGLDLSKVPERGVSRHRVPVKFQPIKKKPREAAWAEHRKSGTRYR